MGFCLFSYDALIETSLKNAFCSMDLLYEMQLQHFQVFLGEYMHSLLENTQIW